MIDPGGAPGRPLMGSPGRYPGRGTPPSNSPPGSFSLILPPPGPKFPLPTGLPYIGEQGKPGAPGSGAPPMDHHLDPNQVQVQDYHQEEAC